MLIRSAARLSRRLLERTLRFGPDDLRRTNPLYPAFGYHRGTPVDRYYIERFLASHAELISGDGLEVGEDRYLSRVGAARLRSVTTFQLADPGPGRLVGDLTQPDALPEGVFDCFICTQTLNFVYDFRSALRSCHRLLKSSGRLLLTVAGTSQISRYDADRWGDYWRFTPQGLTRLALEVFGDTVTVSAWGNVLAATALLHGLVTEEFEPAELDVQDPDYPVVISLVGSKP
jgi:SAM-dependent methyltransferase